MGALGAAYSFYSSDAVCPDQDVCTGKIPRQPLLFGSTFRLQQGPGPPGATCGTKSSQMRQEGGDSRETEEHNDLTWPHAACRYQAKQGAEFVGFVLFLTSAKALPSR